MLPNSCLVLENSDIWEQIPELLKIWDNKTGTLLEIQIQSWNFLKILIKVSVHHDPPFNQLSESEKERAQQGRISG